MRPPVIITAPAVLPVALDEAKKHLRVDHGDDDSLITAYIEAATGHLDGYGGVLGRCIVAQTLEEAFHGLCKQIRLAVPATSIVSITWRNAVGQIATVNEADYALTADAIGSLVRLKDGFSYPTDLYQSEAVTITYIAGYGDGPDDVPAALRAAILLMTGDLYRFRETAETGSVGAVPMSTTVDRLLAPYRRWGV